MLLCAILIAPLARADLDLSSIGVVEADSVKKFNGLRQHGVMLRYRVTSASPRFWIPSSLDLTGGWLTRDGDATPYLSFGPTYRFDIDRREPDNWFIDFGVHPTYVAESRFGDKDLGGSLHFTSSLGLGTYLNRAHTFSALLRYQHTSNAGLSSTNPGVDMLALSFSYHFGDRAQSSVASADTNSQD